MSDEPSATPAPTTTPAPATTTNAPAFTDHEAAREITRLNGLLEASRAENTTLREQVQTLEGQVDETKQKDLEARLTALEAENSTLKGENEKLTGEKALGEQVSALTGKVRDPEAALKLLTDDLKTADGKPDIEKIISKYPYLAPEGQTTPNAPSGGGGPQNSGPATLDAAVTSKDTSAINAAFDAELKGATK
ncbi:hypothetical protein [Deinococcus humi]|uniref:Regulator of replication initiation timing n=1 Tax=Deinococcus humi TaxID=662880 RepID=A0A7W8JUB2_9DEIO|nr:hypothetical protein [Deinococcus humi]MBB5363085.1 regulator of replication initiation timing [Deinococcus humi]GGO24780.1 hypothetical protein GCM10008949_14010 [Deinococcus humi]